MSGGGSGEKDEGLSPHLRNIALPGPPRRQGPYPEEEEEQQGRRETYPPRYAPSSAFHSQAPAPRETPFGSLLPAVFGEHPGPSRRGDEQSARPSGPSWSQASWAPPPDPLAQSSRSQSVRSSQSSYTDPHRGPYHEDERARMAGPSSQREPSPPRRIVREPQGYHHYDDHGRVASESERYYTSRSQEAFVGPSTHRARPVPPADTSSIPHGSQIRPAHRDPGFRTAAAPQSVPVHTQVQLPSIETLLVRQSGELRQQPSTYPVHERQPHRRHTEGYYPPRPQDQPQSRDYAGEISRMQQAAQSQYRPTASHFTPGPPPEDERMIRRQPSRQSIAAPPFAAPPPYAPRTEILPPPPDNEERLLRRQSSRQSVAAPSYAPPPYTTSLADIRPSAEGSIEHAPTLPPFSVQPPARMPSFRAYQPRPTPLSDLAAQEGLQTREGDERSGMQAGPPPTYSRVDPQGRIQKPYQKVPLACEFCKKRKIRCDGDRPCWNCLSRGVHCEYAIRRRTRGPGKAPKGSRKKNSGKARAASTTSSSSQYPPSTYASSSHLSESISPTSETQPQDLVFGHQRDPTLPFAGLAERYPASLEQPQAGPSRRSRGRTAGGRLSISEDEAPRAPKKVKREDHVEYSRPHGRQDDDEEDEDDYDDYDEDEEEG